MMPPTHSANRSMFWRIVRRLLTANRARLFVILLALGAGAAVTAALLNLQVDARRRLSTEFRALGANVLVTPQSPVNATASPNVMDASAFDKLPTQNDEGHVISAEFLYGIVDVVPRQPSADQAPANLATRAVLAGFMMRPVTVAYGLEKISPSTVIESQNLESLHQKTCEVGQGIARALRIHAGTRVTLKNGGQQDFCAISKVRSFGGPEDNQIFLELSAAQALLKLSGKISLIQASVPGTPASIDRFINTLAAAAPDADVRGIRQFTETEGKIYDRISGLLTATVALVLGLTGLCVMAAMTNVAMERKNDVGLMKAIGGATRRVLRLFLVEAALLGLAGGALGAAAGIGLSMGLGKAVFGVAAQPRLIVYPVAVALTMLVAIAGAYPLRRLASVRPASVFRGEA